MPLVNSTPLVKSNLADDRIGSATSGYQPIQSGTIDSVRHAGEAYSNADEGSAIIPVATEGVRNKPALMVIASGPHVPTELSRYPCPVTRSRARTSVDQLPRRSIPSEWPGSTRDSAELSFARGGRSKRIHISAIVEITLLEVQPARVSGGLSPALDEVVERPDCIAPRMCPCGRSAQYPSTLRCERRCEQPGA